jgi:CRISPR/Cas system-associated endonuclease Cas1
MGYRPGRIDAVFIERAGVTVVSRGGRLQSRYRGEYDEIDGDARVIAASGGGFVITSDAVRACTRKHIEIIITDATQSFVAIYASCAPGDASRAGMAMRMRQFAALVDPRNRLVIAKEIARRKIMAEKHEPISRREFHTALEGCGTVDGIRHVEAKSAQEWWCRWRDFELRFRRGFNPPAQWRSFKSRYIGRRQGKSGELPKQFTARFAETPLQALHNFAVSVTAARLVRVIAARHLDPCFGFLHDGRKPGRYSLAWDTIESLRPGLATAIFDYAGAREFERGEFASQDGVVRLSSHVAKECAAVVLAVVLKTVSSPAPDHGGGLATAMAARVA